MTHARAKFFFRATLRKLLRRNRKKRNFAPDIQITTPTLNTLRGGGNKMNMTMTTEQPKPLLMKETGVMALMRTTYSMQEHRYVMMLVYNMQREVGLAISQHARHQRLDLSQTNHQGNEVFFEIPFGQLEVSETHYPALEKALKSCSEKTVGLPYLIETDSNHPHGYGSKAQVGIKDFPRLFRYERSFMRGRKRYAVIIFGIDVLQYLLACDFGYHRLDLNLMFSFRHYASRRLYQLTECRIKLGYDQFYPQLLFGMLTQNSTYAGIGSLESHQLGDALREIKNAYDHHNYDVYLTYSKRHIVNQYSPNTLILVFSTTYRQDDEDGMEKAAKKELDLNKALIKSRLVSFWDINEKVAIDLCSRIKPDMMPRINTLLQEASDKKQQHKLTNPAGFIVAGMSKIVG